MTLLVCLSVIADGHVVRNGAGNVNTRRSELLVDLRETQGFLNVGRVGVRVRVSDGVAARGAARRTGRHLGVIAGSDIIIIVVDASVCEGQRAKAVNVRCPDRTFPVQIGMVFFPCGTVGRVARGNAVHTGRGSGAREGQSAVIQKLGHLGLTVLDVRKDLRQLRGIACWN